MTAVSIIVPVYHSEINILNFLKYICESDEKNIEVVIIIDGMDNSFYDQCAEFIDDRILLIRNEINIGAGPSRNKGINVASGEYLYFFDSDDEFIGLDLLFKMYECAVENKANICGGTIQIIDGKNGAVISEHISQAYSFNREGYVDSYDYQFDYGFYRFLYKKSFIESNHLFFPDYRRYQDPPFMLRAIHCAEKIYAMKDITYILCDNGEKEWKYKQICDLSRGIGECIKFAVNHKYYEVARHNIRRIFADFGRLWFKDNMNNEIVECIKNNQILQKIIFPNTKQPAVQAMYYDVISGVCTGEDMVEIAPCSIVDFNSYFNSFSSSKWKKYTNIKSISLVLLVCGEAEIVLYHNRIFNNNIICKEIKRHTVIAPEKQYIHMDFQELNEVGNYSFVVKTKEKGFTIYDGLYLNNYWQNPRDINLSIAFTTYRRELYIMENIKRLCSLNCDNLSIFVIDNAGTVNLDDIGFDLKDSKTKVRLYKNENTGGAGGFARAMIEIQKRKKDYTHCVLMDDDVTVDPRVIERLIYFMKYMKPEYYMSFIGGSMFRRDLPYMQVEVGAKRSGIEIQSQSCGCDMRNRIECLKTEMFHTVDYNAWWFCVIPCEKINSNNLPLPLFFQWDDVDYGIRNKLPIITLNGICTWHDAFESKMSASYRYYSTRNPLIVNCCHDETENIKKIISTIRKRIDDEIFMFRYENALGLIKGIDDFLKGPEWLCSQNADELNKEIMAMNVKMQPIDDIDYDYFQFCKMIDDCDKFHMVIRKITKNGYRRKANKNFVLPLYECYRPRSYRAQTITFYDEIRGNGYICNRNKKKAKMCWKLSKKSLNKLKKQYDTIKTEYKKRYEYMISLEMWSKYLNL